MTNDKCIDDFNREINCTYKDEQYSVRDNGTVLKHSHIGKRPRPTDNQWTFGKPNDKTGYMEIASVRIHRIVATAFHGEPPTKEHVVDHIDTNKRNNRPENLRWVTRLENVLLNPITVKRIELACGCKVEEFLANPSKFRDRFQEPNYSWMCTVSEQEGQSSLDRMLSWAKSDKLPSGGSLGEWIFNRSTRQDEHHELISDFPVITICPQKSAKPINDYAENLKAGSIFCQNDSYSSLVFKYAISDDRQSLYVISESTESENAIKPWALAKITFEDGLFVHTSHGSFFTQEGVEKYYCLAQGLEWTGGDTLDDLV